MSKSKIRPLQDRIIVARLENDEKTASGLYIPDSAQEKPQQGKVIAVGKGKIMDDGSARPVDLAVGDVIIFGKYSGQESKVDGEEVLIMKMHVDVYGAMVLALKSWKKHDGKGPADSHYGSDISRLLPSTEDSTDLNTACQLLWENQVNKGTHLASGGSGHPPLPGPSNTSPRLRER